jgi:putative transposase
MTSAWLCSDVARSLLREAINHIRKKYPFTINAIVLLPDHLHCIWTLPDGDHDFGLRWRLIKTYVTKHGQTLGVGSEINVSRQRRGEGNLWQRRFWEHVIRDEEDYARHCDYIHYNPVRHKLCTSPGDWPYSSFHRFAKEGIYSHDWGADSLFMIPTVGTPEPP